MEAISLLSVISLLSLSTSGPLLFLKFFLVSYVTNKQFKIFLSFVKYPYFILALFIPYLFFARSGGRGERAVDVTERHAV